MARPYEFHTLTPIIYFEAAARHSGFNLAAKEMNVTPAAVSHQIKALEESLGCKLFVRRARGIDLTQKGEAFFSALKGGFEVISDAVSAIRDRQIVNVTIRTTSAFSALWLTPKISTFWTAHPTVTVSQIVSDVAGGTTRCDLSIRYGVPKDDGNEWLMLFHDQITAIGTSDFADQHKIRKIEDLLTAPLIHPQLDETDWTTWADWFAAFNMPLPEGRGFHVNNYMIALQAAQNDVGAVLGWSWLVRDLIKSGKLIQLVKESMPSPCSFYLVIDSRASLKARLFADWLVESSKIHDSLEISETSSS